jgi:hypothetical protein
VSLAQLKVMTAIERCRTAALGSGVDAAFYSAKNEAAARAKRRGRVRIRWRTCVAQCQRRHTDSWRQRLRLERDNVTSALPTFGRYVARAYGVTNGARRVRPLLGL